MKKKISVLVSIMLILWTGIQGEATTGKTVNSVHHDGHGLMELVKAYENGSARKMVLGFCGFGKQLGFPQSTHDTDDLGTFHRFGTSSHIFDRAVNGKMSGHQDFSIPMAPKQNQF